MAEQIAQDPSFAQMAQAMQANMGAMMGGAGPPEAPTSTRGAAPAEPAMPGMPPGMPGMPGMDPSAYANMMSGVMQNPQFVEMAEKLGQQIMQVLTRHWCPFCSAWWSRIQGLCGCTASYWYL